MELTTSIQAAVCILLAAIPVILVTVPIITIFLILWTRR